MQPVGVYLDGTDDLLLSATIDLSKTTDVELNDIFVQQLCGHEKAFCDHCFGGKITFHITRCCDHKIAIWPMVNGQRIPTLEAEDVDN